MDTKSAVLKRAFRSGAAAILLALVVIVCIPLLVPLVLAYGLYALVLHILLWLFWSPAGKRVLLVYSNSPVWQSHIEDNILPRLPRGSVVVLNWSERRRWRWWWLSAALFRYFGGSREFNPLAVVVQPLRWGRTFRFWRAFRDAKHGNQVPLRTIETQFFTYAGLSSRR